MARPCGCGSSGVIVHCGDGLSCVGVGTAGDPLVISWQIPLGSVACNAVMDCVGANLSSGLQYFPATHRVGAKISTDAGNLLGFGTDGGLLSTGSPDPSLGGVTVAGLPATNLLGSTYGAGYEVWPDGYLRSYEAAMGHEHLGIIHAPVRRSQDFLLYAVHDRNLGWYTHDTNTNAPIPTHPTPGVPAPWAHEMIVRPSGLPDGATVDNPYNVTYGYAGFAYPAQQGILLLEDVFRVTARRKCLWLECKDVGGSADTVAPAFTLFRIALLVEKWGLQKSVIVSAQLPVGDQDVAGLKTGLQYCLSKGMEIAAQITTPAEATANSPASLVTLGCTWVGLSYALPDSVIATYVAAGLKVMMLAADRQWQWTKQQTLGVRGAFCLDPIYTAAHTYGFRYRNVNPPAEYPHIFSGQAANYGRCGYSASLSGSHAKYRGWVDRGAGAVGYLKAGPEMVPPGETAFHIPMGVFCPVYDSALTDPPPAGNYGSPTNYDLDVTVGVAGLNWQPSGQQGLGLFFCVPKDVRLFDTTAATVDTIGYSFQLLSSGMFVFRRYSGTPANYSYSDTWSSGWSVSSFLSGAEFRIMVQVRPGTIRVGPATANGGITGAQSRLYTAGTPAGAGADLHRGPYFYLSFFEANPFLAYRHFKDLKVVNY